LAWGLAALLIAVAWRWGGLRAADGPFFSAAAMLLQISALAFPGRSGSGAPGDGFSDGWLRDLFFWSGLLFLAYLGCQWWNAGRELVYDPSAQRWAYAPPRHPACPWAIARPEAAQMLHWFFPAWAIGTVVRSPRMSRRELNGLARALLFGAGALAVAGLIELLSGARGRFWRMPPGCDSFASFGYGNHAAAYFVMLGALAVGMLFREGFRRDRPANKWALAGWAAGLLLCLAGANLSLSRTGVLLAGLLAALAAGYGLVRSWRGLRPAARFRWAAATAAVGILLYFAVVGSGGPAIRAEFAVKRQPLTQLIPAWQTVNLDLSVRPRLWGAAGRMIKTHPWCGTGGGGFRHLGAFHLPETAWRSWRSNPGNSNVHCDPLQFLAEFGLVGSGLLALALGALLAPLFRAGIRRGAVFTFVGVGLAAVFAFSWIDLPFRCPAILWTWTALLAALPKWTSRHPAPFPDGTDVRSEPPQDPRT
jgi:hypothetical protein